MFAIARLFQGPERIAAEADASWPLAAAFAVLGFISFNVVLIFIALFIYLGAQQEGAEEELKELLASARVRDLMSYDAGSVDAAMPLGEAANVMLAQRRESLAVAQAGSIVGVLRLDDVRAVPREKGTASPLAPPPAKRPL